MHADRRMRRSILIWRSLGWGGEGARFIPWRARVSYAAAGGYKRTKGFAWSVGRREETTFSRLKIVCPGKPRTGPLLGVKAERIEINLSSGDWKRCLLYWLERCNWLVIDYNREMIFDRLDTLWKWKLCSCIFFSTDPCTVPCSVMIPRALGDFN